MGISRATAEMIITRDGEGRRAVRAGTFSRRLIPLRNDEDYETVVRFARWHGIVGMLIPFVTAAIIVFVENRGAKLILLVAAMLLIAAVLEWRRRVMAAAPTSTK